MVAVTRLIHILNYDTLARDKIIPDLCSQLSLPKVSHTMAIRNYQAYSFLGHMLEKSLLHRLGERFPIYKFKNRLLSNEEIFDSMNPGYAINFQECCDIDLKALSIQLTKHLQLSNSKFLNINEECQLNNLQGRIDLLGNQHIIEIKATTSDISKIKLALLQILSYAAMRRCNHLEVKFVSVVYILQEQVYTFDIEKWDSHYFAALLYRLSN
jgi:hypothetical protein